MSDRENRNSEALSNIFYQTGRTRAAFKALQEVLEHGWELNYCKATRLFGPPGVGKSQVLTFFDKEVCKLRGWKMLTIEIASGTNPRLFGEQVLAGLGDPCPEHGSVDDKLSRAKEAVQAQNIDLIAFEEFQFLIDGKTDRVNHAIGQWVTNFLNMRACPLVLSGELSAERVLQGNRMLHQRTFPGCTFKPYDWGLEQDRREFRETMHAIDRQLGMAETSGLGTPDIAQRIYAFAEGVLRVAADLIAKSRREARERGLPRISKEVFADVADEFLSVSPEGKANPFRTNVMFDPNAAVEAKVVLLFPEHLRAPRDRNHTA